MARLLLVAQSVGFTLAETRVLPDPKSEWRELSRTKLAKMGQSIKRLRVMQRMLEGALQCDCIRPEACAALTPKFSNFTD